MIDQALMAAIRDYLHGHTGLSELSSADSERFITRLGQLHMRSADAIWWWQDLKDRCEVVNYEEADADALSLILSRLPKELPARLVITDDEPQPWPVIAGTVGTLVELIREQRYFEYMLAAESGSWVVFDTHHNELIFIGDIVR
jgi:hypothetical protein